MATRITDLRKNHITKKKVKQKGMFIGLPQQQWEQATQNHWESENKTDLQSYTKKNKIFTTTVKEITRFGSTRAKIEGGGQRSLAFTH